MNQKRSVFLIPSYLSVKNDASFIAPMVLDVIKSTNVFFVENVRTTRRFISSLNLGIDISELTFEVLDKKTNYHQISRLFEQFKTQDIGIVSEAGLPGLADPGHLVIGFAQKNNINVVPLPGASSIQTALIASGFNGQKFTFHGYLPIDKGDRIKAIIEIEKEMIRSNVTQIFMETPFRNMSLFKDLVENLESSTFLHLSVDLFGNKALIKSKTISDWRKFQVDLHKIPTVFCLGQIS